MKRYVFIVLIGITLPFVFCIILFLIDYNKYTRKPEETDLRKVEQAGFILPSHYIILSFFTSNGREGDYNCFVFYSKDEFRLIEAQLPSDTNRYDIEDNESIKLIMKIINKSMAYKFWWNYYLKEEQLVKAEFISFDAADHTQVRADIITAKMVTTCIWNYISARLNKGRGRIDLR